MTAGFRQSVAIEGGVIAEPQFCIDGGQRGRQLRVAPADAAKAFAAVLAPIIA